MRAHTLLSPRELSTNQAKVTHGGFKFCGKLTQRKRAAPNIPTVFRSELSCDPRCFRFSDIAQIQMSGVDTPPIIAVMRNHHLRGNLPHKHAIDRARRSRISFVVFSGSEFWISTIVGELNQAINALGTKSLFNSHGYSPCGDFQVIGRKVEAFENHTRMARAIHRRVPVVVFTQTLDQKQKTREQKNRNLSWRSVALCGVFKHHSKSVVTGGRYVQ